MPRGPRKNAKSEKKVTRYTYDEVKEPRTPETGHTALLPADEQVVTLPMDNGWSKAIEIGRLPEGDDRPVVVDMDPAADPVLFWAGKRNKREVPVLPLQRNEIVSDSRIAQIIERARKAAAEKVPQARQGSLFADLEKTLRESDRSKRVEFYTHEEGWKNKLICGDSLHVMESLLHYEGMRGKVQMIYIDPPYGVDYDSNFQQRIDSPNNDPKATGGDDILSIKAFRDTWTLGVHSYLSYLADRFYLCRELLRTSGSVFVQVNDAHLHLVRILMSEVFGEANFVSLIPFRKKTMPLGSNTLENMSDYLIWYARERETMFYQPVFVEQDVQGKSRWTWFELPDGSRHRMTSQQALDHRLLPDRARVFRLVSQRAPSFNASNVFPCVLDGKTYRPPAGGCWVTNEEGMKTLADARRLMPEGDNLSYVLYHDDFPLSVLTNPWHDTTGPGKRVYSVQTGEKVVERCLWMTTVPGDLVLDPTCGSGTTAVCAERWGRRWVTVDTSRVAVNTARRELLVKTFPHFVLLASSVDGGFKYRRVPRITSSTVIRRLEPEPVELVDDPEVNEAAIRVCGPFEVMSLGRYSVEDWKGYVVAESSAGYGEPAKLVNYIEVICRLYRKDAAIQGASGLVHAVAETEKEKIAISVGPLSGRVTAKQINDAVQDALASGILEVHVLGWAFEANVGEVKSQLESRGKVKVELVMIRPDTLAEGLKATQPEMLFSPLALPDIEVTVSRKGKNGAEAVVTLNGVALFDRKHRRTEYKRADSGYVSAWYLDEDYDGDCFVDCQMFFDFKKAPNLRAALRAEVDPEEFTLKVTSEPFPVRGYKRVAVKVVDVYGNESTVVQELR